MSRDRRVEFEHAVMPHLGAAHDLARWLMRHPQEAEDAVQEAFLKAFRAFDGYAGGSARAWILAIVRNTCMTRLERLRSDRKVVVLDVVGSDRDLMAADTLRDPGLPADEALAREEDRKRVHKALRMLPEPYREVLILRELHDLSYRDVAEAVRVSVGTVMSRLSRGRARMRVLLADETVDPPDRRTEDEEHG